MAPEETESFRPPYPAFKTFTNFLEGLEEKQSQFPPRIDRSYLRGLSGVSQSQLLAALRAFDLIEDDGTVTDSLKVLATHPEERPNLIGGLVRTHYPAMVRLGEANATQQMLEDEFSKYGVTGSTRRKAISFFLKAAEWGGVPLSPHFTTPKVSASTPARRRRVQVRSENGRAPEASEPLGDQSSGDAKQRYIDLLLKKAEQEMDDALLDRIERVIGVQAAEGKDTKD